MLILETWFEQTYKAWILGIFGSFIIKTTSGQNGYSNSPAGISLLKPNTETILVFILNFLNSLYLKNAPASDKLKKTSKYVIYQNLHLESKHPH